MSCTAIYNYAIPCSQGHVEAREKFQNLGLVKKVMVVALSAIAWTATLFLAGVGGYVAFKSLTDLFTVEDDAAHSAKPKLNLLKDGMSALELMDLYVEYQQIMQGEQTERIQELESQYLARSFKVECLQILHQLPQALEKSTPEEVSQYKDKYKDCPDLLKHILSKEATFLSHSELAARLKESSGGEEFQAATKREANRRLAALSAARRSQVFSAGIDAYVASGIQEAIGEN